MMNQSIKFVTFIIILFFSYYKANSQFSPRRGENAEAKGYYDIVTRVNNAIVNREDDLIVEIYITGYGQIGTAKFVFYPSIRVIDTIESTVTFDIKREALGSGIMYSWGETTMPIREQGINIGLVGGKIDKRWINQKPTLFFDIDTLSKIPQIFTETNQLGLAPIVLNLKIKKGAAPGNHFLNFGFTYFNGQEWVGSNHQIPFTIRNIFQRYEVLISILGLIAVIFTIIASMLTIRDFIIKIRKSSPTENSQQKLRAQPKTR